MNDAVHILASTEDRGVHGGLRGRLQIAVDNFAPQRHDGQILGLQGVVRNAARRDDDSLLARNAHGNVTCRSMNEAVLEALDCVLLYFGLLFLAIKDFFP